MNIPYLAFGLELLNVLFYFAGFVALAVFLSRLLFCRGMVCASARADAVISSFEFALWGVTTFLMVKDIMRGGMRKPGVGGAAFRGPNMQEKPIDA